MRFAISALSGWSKPKRPHQGRPLDWLSSADETATSGVKSMMDINTAAIIVGTNGFVWYTPQVIEADDHLTLVDARIIRIWGTDKGLAQLVTGPREETVIDTAATVILSRSAFLFAIPCSTWSVK